VAVMQRRNLHFFFVAGEPSGDVLGASLIRSLRSKHPAPLKVTGIGGPNMEREGLVKTADMDQLAVMGFLEVLPHVPRLYSLLRRTIKCIRESEPDFVVTVDSKGFNFRLIKALRREPRGSKTKIVHYVAPSMWAIKGEQREKKMFLSRNLDLLLVLFPFEQQYFSSFLRTVCTGPPVFELAAIRRRAMQAPVESTSSSLPPSKQQISDPVLLLLPGSRVQEVRQHLPILLEVVRSMGSKHCLQFRILTILSMKELVDNLVESRGLKESIQVITLLDVEKRIEHMRGCSAAVAVSGTVTLELAAADVPSVVIYRSNMFTQFLAKRLAAVEFISLPNLLLGQRLLPELLFGACNQDDIEHEACKLLFDKAERKCVLAGYSRVMKIACPRTTATCTNEEKFPEEQSPSMIAATAILQLQNESSTT